MCSHLVFCLQILNIAKGVSIAPLGQDRAYRRYWLFNSLSGLFVEDYETNPGLCRLTPTPYNPESNPELSEALNELFRNQAEKNITKVLSNEKEEKSNSDKENESGSTPDKPTNVNVSNKTVLQVPNHVPNGIDAVNPGVKEGADAEQKMDVDEKNATDTDEKNATDGNASADVASENSGNDDDDGEDSLLEAIGKLMNDSGEKEPPPIYGLCTANMENCPVHSERKDHHRWHFYHSLEDVHSLIEALNTRGYREKELKSQLECYRANIDNSLRSCPVYKLDPSQVVIQMCYWYVVMIRMTYAVATYF